jgi:hypothetical protein
MERKLEGQFYVKEIARTWKDLADNVNTMAANLTGIIIYFDAYLK